MYSEEFTSGPSLGHQERCCGDAQGDGGGRTPGRRQARQADSE